MIEIDWDDRRVTKALRDLQNAVGDLTPAFLDMREHLIESTKQRFVSKTAPDGTHWKKNSDVTIDRKGRNDPLNDLGTLGQQIAGDIIDGHILEIYSDREYAAMQQFGGTTDEFPQLWGDIPARPFLGISFEDDAYILDTIREHVKDAMK